MFVKHQKFAKHEQMNHTLQTEYFAKEIHDYDKLQGIDSSA